jgi:hypothetical protein
LGGVYRIGYQLTKENLVVRIEKFFDNRKNVLSVNGDVTCFFHVF